MVHPRDSSSSPTPGAACLLVLPGCSPLRAPPRETGDVSFVDYTVEKDECNRADTTLEGLQSLKPIRLEDDANATITAGNASQLSDGASACLLMEEKEAERRGLAPLGAFKVGPRRLPDTP